MLWIVAHLQKIWNIAYMDVTLYQETSRGFFSIGLHNSVSYAVARSLRRDYCPAMLGTDSLQFQSYCNSHDGQIYDI